jgi:hypothetical protein
MVNSGILTTAEHSSQVQPSSTLGRRMASYHKLEVITSTGKFAPIARFKIPLHFFRTGCSVNIVGQEQQF